MALAAVSLLLPAAATADEPAARGRTSVSAGAGVTGDTPFFTLTGSHAFWDDGATRAELAARVGLSVTKSVVLDGSMGIQGAADADRLILGAELVLSRRIGRFEPWISVGVATVASDGDFLYFCNTTDAPACRDSYLQPGRRDYTGTWVTGPTGAGGLRYVVARGLLLEGQLRHEKEGRSRFDEVGGSQRVGGWAGVLSAVWRFSPGGVAAAGPSSGAVGPGPRRPAGGEALAPATAQTRPASACEPEAPRLFTVHERVRFRCFPDPIRGGSYCEPQGTDGSYVERSACEAACRGGEEACPAGVPGGEACQRCVASCAKGLAVACTAANRGAPEGADCRLEAGSYGLVQSRVVPATCPGAR
ncbi:MAG TPA: hypothetical protein VLT61_09175 [Anaeromyxobacteraceae bacterium]|nr:hypothetical protein [Anaeromyxobacteraceae bacterium]